MIQQLGSGPGLCSWLGLVKEDHPCASPCVGENAKLAAEVAEVCIEAVMRPHQASGGIRSHVNLARTAASLALQSVYCSDGVVGRAHSIAA